MTAIFSYTSDFRQEFEAETGTLLRRRFTRFAVGNLALYILAHFLFAGIGAAIVAWTIEPDRSRLSRIHDLIVHYFDGWTGFWSVVCLAVVEATVCIGVLRYTKRMALTTRQLVLLTQWMFFICGVLDIGSYLFGAHVGFPLSVMVAHMLACTLMPWTVMQCLRPMVPLLLLNALTVMLFSIDDMTARINTCVLSLLSLLPGVLICRLRLSRRLDRFKLSFLQDRYGQLRRELVDARRIHESLFPKPHGRGLIRFDYRYLPMRLIGGDYLYVKHAPQRGTAQPTMSAILIDVTGHGIVAALTVNRLYGEIERYFAEHPHAGPGDVLRNLNRYVHLTLANHSIYATALCLRIDTAHNSIEFASGGHPPAFLRAVDGTIEQLGSTSFVLGAAAADDFEPAPESRHFGPGDTLIAYTDGATEARNEKGRMLGVNGLQRIIAGTPAVTTGGWSPAILAAVDSHRIGAPTDDTLIVEIYRTISMDTDPGFHKRRTREHIVVRSTLS
ncbi:MAG: serine/threonine-protein phosphatase [Pyrinomonadaceae bacterium]|nr:serine/threonine-protein phosphatase [Phycisphaerales bacterium]